MTAFYRFLLWQQLASPVIQEREAAARELGNLVLVDADSLLPEMLSWLQSQRTESRTAEALMPLVWAHLRDGEAALPAFADLTSRVSYPSMLTAKLIKLLYDRAPDWDANMMFSDGFEVDQIDRLRFARLRKSVAGYLKSPRIPNAWKTDFEELFIREFAVVDGRLGRPSIDKLRYGQPRDEYIPNYHTDAVDSLVSGFQRACAAASGRHGTAQGYEWYSCPIAPALWLAPREMPQETLAALLQAPNIDAVCTELGFLQNNDVWPLRIHARVQHETLRLVDLHIIAFYQRVIGDGVPTVGELLDRLGPPQLLTAYDNLDEALSSHDDDGWTSRLDGWEVTPASLCVAPRFAALWQADTIMREQAIPLGRNRVRATVVGNRDSMQFATDDHEIASTHYWLVRPELKRPFEVPAPIGVATVAGADHVRQMAADLRSVPAFAVRRTEYSRQSGYGDYEMKVDEAYVGTTRLLLP